MKYLCVNMQGELELWAHVVSEGGLIEYYQCIEADNSYAIASIFYNPELWGREIIEEWNE